MKTHLYQLLFAICAGGAIASSAHAATYRIVADIPFAFHVGAQTFQPGEYIFERPRVSSDVQFMTSSATGARVAAVLGGNELERPGHARLVFRDYGDSKYLGDIWTRDGSGMKIPVSKVERAERKRWQSNEVPMSPAGME